MIKYCEKCNGEFPTWLKIDGKFRNLTSRRFCLNCTPFGTHNTKDIIKYQSSINKEGEKRCNYCDKFLPIESFYIRKDSKNKPAHAYCKNCCSKITIERQTVNKLELVNYKGGKCSCCDYDRYIGALEFHHVDPNSKDFNLCNKKTYSFESIKNEIDKCILLCSNCHREIHNGIILVILENSESGQDRTDVMRVKSSLLNHSATDS